MATTAHADGTSAAEGDITYFARAHHRVEHRRQMFGIRQADLRSHMYIVGKTGTGKSTLIKTMVLQDIAAGRGVALLDPHGDLVDEILRAVPEQQRPNVIYLDTPRGNWTFNPVADVPRGQEALATAELIEVFKKIWTEEWGPRLEHLLRNVLFTLFEMPGASLADVGPLLADKKHCAAVARSLENTEVRHFWLDEFARYSQPFRAVVVAPLQNKLGAFLTDPRINRIITAERSSFDLIAAMDGGRALLVNLSRGQIGEGPAMLLGALLAARIGLAGLARAQRPETERRDFHLYMDEFQMFATLSLATMLAQLRKYRVGLILANQYLGQLDTEVRDAVLGNAGTLVAFRASAEDAAFLAHDFEPVFEAMDLIRIPRYQIYLKLMIDGQVSEPFSAETLNGACVLQAEDSTK